METEQKHKYPLGKEVWIITDNYEEDVGDRVCRGQIISTQDNLIGILHNEPFSFLSQTIFVVRLPGDIYWDYEEALAKAEVINIEDRLALALEHNNGKSLWPEDEDHYCPCDMCDITREYERCRNEEK